MPIPYKKSAYREVFEQADEVVREMQEWNQRTTGKWKKLRFKIEDQPRLLRLRSWSLCNRISISEILQLIMPILSKQVRKKTYGLGVPLKVLTGTSARRILNSQIEKYYPDGENVSMWREDERQRQIHREREEELEGLPAAEDRPMPVLQEDEEMEDFVAKYNKRIMQQRLMNRRITNQKWRRRKNYRQNPW